MTGGRRPRRARATRPPKDERDGPARARRRRGVRGDRRRLRPSLPAGVGPWPAAEDVDDDAPDEPVDEAPGPAAVRAAPAARSLRRRARPAARRRRRAGQHGAARGTASPTAPACRRDEPGVAADGDPDDDRERFVPPEAAADHVRPTWCRGWPGWGCSVARCSCSSRRSSGTPLPAIVVLLTLGAFIGGFVTLVVRLPRDRGDDADDGAVV